MISGDVAISEGTRARLDPSVLAEVKESLWRVDCQSCGLSLGTVPAALAIDQAGGSGWASLHHLRCREPGWTSSSVVALNPAFQSHRSLFVLLPVHDLSGRAGRGNVLPVMIVNPALECVPLSGAGERWQVQIEKDFTAAGLAPPGQGVLPDPARGASATLTGASAAVTVRTRPNIVYQSWLDGDDVQTAQMRRVITSQGGILLAVSHLVDPAAIDDVSRQLEEAIRTGRLLLGWAALTDPEGRP